MVSVAGCFEAPGTGQAAPPEMPGVLTAAVFDPALTGMSTRLHLDDGRTLLLPARRWHEPAGRVDQWLLQRCHGPALDLGCGPGRLVEALLHSGIPALGVDCSALAVRFCLVRGAPVLHGDVFAPLPAEGHWAHVLLADGNIGIGGDPVALLRRAASLLTPGGSVLLEVGTQRSGLWRGQARLYQADCGAGPWFPWAILGLNALPDLAHRAGLRMVGAHRGRHRCFAQLAHHGPDPHAGTGTETPDRRVG